MKNLYRVLLVLFVSTAFALALIPRAGTIEIPDVAINNGCIGNAIAGVDVDGDGAKEIYMINNNSNDTDVGELVPRIYKLEWDGSAYVKVWEANAQDFDPTITQNTWPPLSLTDLDDDGNMELYLGHCQCRLGQSVSYLGIRTCRW
ncbi:MAG: hypothetical protein U5N56_10750 [Candidatus Marinimicrobia bacterium]|nr:hypothetical protein [Candidatus Neomarinimicrobiota bacterium]